MNQKRRESPYLGREYPVVVRSDFKLQCGGPRTHKRNSRRDLNTYRNDTSDPGVEALKIADIRPCSEMFVSLLAA